TLFRSHAAVEPRVSVLPRPDRDRPLRPAGVVPKRVRHQLGADRAATVEAAVVLEEPDVVPFETAERIADAECRPGIERAEMLDSAGPTWPDTNGEVVTLVGHR